jgi:hypothetical protein
VKAGKEMEGHNEPAAGLACFFKLPHRCLNQLLLQFM